MRIFLLGKNVIDVKQIKKNVFKKVNIYFRYGLSLCKNKNIYLILEFHMIFIIPIIPIRAVLYLI